MLSRRIPLNGTMKILRARHCGGFSGGKMQLLWNTFITEF